MSRIRALWAIGLAALVLGAVADEIPCTTHTSDGQYFDLNPLKSSDDYKFKSPSGNEYKINVCRPVASETWALKVEKPEEVAGFVRRDHGDFSIGSMNTTVAVTDGHPVLTFTEGTACSSSNDLRASTVIRFVCDTSVSGMGQPQLIAQLPPSDESACAFFIEWRTHVACPTHENGSWGFMSILATIVGIVFGLYIVCSVFYNYFVLQLRGFDLVPRYSLFSLGDTIEFIRGCVERIRSRGSDPWEGYRGVSASHEEGVSILSGPPGFLDEEDEEEDGMDRDGIIRL
ncbi:mannose-6-phosphate receptor binding domain-containing protein [Cristinia sonorae]|uniref:Autophagy-related protein 27 n=1 Tax=Cristinia sonorae TaxID=1940300 RepID=A0A8K0UK33_9AGAR|nr:mannose-6-phosphate receptor binding domain-containing protein [Cristinia sonorae]